MAHEINNPINSIINYAQIIFNKNEEESREKYISGEIMAEGDRISYIVKALLSFSREDTMEKHSVNIKEIYDDSISLAAIQFGKDGIRIEKEIPCNLPPVYGQPTQIQQVFLNILNNAQYALNKKYNDSHPDKKLDVRAFTTKERGKEYVKLVFKDYGCGIPSDIKNKLMDPFFTTRPAGEGTGLGLSISYGIIKDHKGRLEIDSKEGEYTEVFVLLPVFENPASG